jgi:hypothetical protein
MSGTQLTTFTSPTTPICGFPCCISQLFHHYKKIPVVGYLRRKEVYLAHSSRGLREGTGIRWYLMRASWKMAEHMWEEGTHVQAGSHKKHRVGPDLAFYNSFLRRTNQDPMRSA